ncbi:arabinogalactan oligomer / maltooligosaccharide transport system permease protein [Spiroplasma litorale]|uniref:Arabinogalactan oligomer / maltooligosaccharide transport system permease protein n=1 Tax=Spiroplasma litorale TaxID=216942 RepID=A0A0K1W2A2_9MOLU|nr:sugar ABC transporter permease [Spiroplasma litorale]AKX34293.1 arabinogalactan oligomer / maltooligosaccharide transport system permease protein [Spiroplasma litorale]
MNSFINSQIDFLNKEKQLTQLESSKKNNDYAKKIYLELKSTIKNDLTFLVNVKQMQFINNGDVNNKNLFSSKKINSYLENKDEQFIRRFFYKKSELKNIKADTFNNEKELEYIEKKEHYWTLRWYSLKNKYIKKINILFLSLAHRSALKIVKKFDILLNNDGDIMYSKKVKYSSETIQNNLLLQKKEYKNLIISIKNDDKLEKLNKIKSHYENYKDFNYDYEYKYKKCIVDIEYYNEINNIKESHLNNIKNFRKQIFKTNATEKINLFTKIKIYKKNYDDYRSEKFTYISEIKKNKLNRAHGMQRINNEIPIENKSRTIWLATLFMLIPGASQFIHKQNLKAIIYLLLLPLNIIFLIYSLGIINIGGNGIFGLGDFGKSTPGPDTDGRYYLVEGVLSIVFLTFVLGYWICNIYDSIIVNKQINMGARPHNNSQTRNFLSSQGVPYIVSLPAILSIIFLSLVPIFATVLIAFTNYGKGNDPAKLNQYISWVGFENFTTLFAGEYKNSFAYVLQWTLIWTILASVGGIIAGWAASFLMNNKRVMCKPLLRLVMMLPWAIPSFITILVFSILLGSKQVNDFTQKYLGVSGWRTKESEARTAIIFIQAWLAQSNFFLLVTGIRQTISKDLEEASIVDGTSRAGFNIKIVIPIIATQIAPMLLATFIANFGNFNMIALYNANVIATDAAGIPLKGNPGVVDIFISFIYKLSTTASFYNYGISAAMLLISSSIVVALNAISLRRMKVFKNK